MTAIEAIKRTSIRMSTPNASPISYRRTNARSYSEHVVSPYGPMSSPGKPIQSINLTMKQTPERNANWLGSLNSHSHFVTTRSNRVNLVCSLLYLLFNVIHHYSNEHFHSITFVWLSDCALSTLNGLMLVAAACYWVSYVERVKFDSEVLRMRNQLAYSQSVNAQFSSPVADKLEGGFVEENLVDFVDPTESENLIQQQLHADYHLPHSHSHVTSSSPSKQRVYTAFVVYFLSFIPRQFGVSYSHMLQTMHVSLIVSPRLYILSVLGVAEFLNMFGSLFYYVSSFFPVIASTQQMVLGGMRESVEAKLDEISYGFDAIAMIAFVLSAVLYFFTWKRHFPIRQSSLSASLFGFLYDPEFWANVWNSAGGVCYALSILYGLAIRVQLAQQEQDTWDYIQEGTVLEDQSIEASSNQLVFDSMSRATAANISDVLLNYTQSVVNFTMSDADKLPVDVFAEAESTVGLSAWQTALFGLTLEQKGMMVLGDVMYAICALVTQFADPSSSMRGGASRSRRTSGRLPSQNRKSNDENSQSQANVEQVPLMHPSEDTSPHFVQVHRASPVDSVT